MSRLRAALAVVILLTLALQASAQTTGRAFIMDMGQGRYLGMVITSDGQMVLLSDVMIVSPTPPTPAKKAAWVMILYESETETDITPVLTASVTDTDLSKKVKMRFDQNAKDPDREPLEIVTQALEFRRQEAQRGGQPVLPAVVGYSSGGSPAVSAKCPDTVEGFRQLLRGWGL